MTKVLILCITLFTLLTGCGKGDSMDNNTEQQLDFQQLSMQEGLELMEADTDYILLDVRRIDEFEAGHIPGAIFPMNPSEQKRLQNCRIRIRQSMYIVEAGTEVSRLRISWCNWDIQM